MNALAELGALLEREDADALLGACGSLRGRADRLRNAVRALEEGEVVAHGGSSFALPVMEHVLLAITLQSDPVSGKIYAAGFRRLRGQKASGTGANERILVAGSQEACDGVVRDFLRTLRDELEALHRYNRDSRSW